MLLGPRMIQIYPAADFSSDSAAPRPKLSLVQSFRTTWFISWLRSKFAFKHVAKGPGIEGLCRELPWILGLDHLNISLAMVFTHCIYTNSRCGSDSSQNHRHPEIATASTGSTEAKISGLANVRWWGHIWGPGGSSSSARSFKSKRSG